MRSAQGACTLLDRAEALYANGQYADAALLCRSILLQNSDDLEATFLLATISYACSSWDESVHYYQRACLLSPETGFLWINLALALQACRRSDEALAALGKAECIDGPSVSLHYNRGVLLQQLERMDDARAEFERALAIDPAHLSSWTNLTAIYLANGDTVSAIKCCYHGLHLAPDHAALTGNLAAAYGKAFRFEDSLIWYQRLLELVKADEQAEILGRMANCLSENWMVEAAIECFDRAIIASVDSAQKRALASTRLFILHYSPRWSAEKIALEHRSWGEHVTRSTHTPCFNNSPDPGRPVRVAYISPDLRIHAVVFFLQPVLAAHDPAQVTVYCYSDVDKPDAVTCQLQQQHNVIWRDCAGFDDDTVLEMLHEDQIDILVDLAGHTAGNRLTLFARRGAPLQITWLGYPNTTGLQQMDYRITDSWADPPGLADQRHTEKLTRLPDSFLCYRPGADFPDVGRLPYLTNGWITFGTFSNFKKVTPVMLDLWAQVVAAVPDSRFVFRARGMTDERFSKDIAPFFSRHNVAPERITMLGHARSVVANLEDYHRIDIALDTFPYHGTTTTCESLYMGVPVVTLAGDSHVSRVGCSLLHSIGLQELIADSSAQYRSIAVCLARDLGRLQELRNGLRERLMTSPVTDNVLFTCHLEQVYREIWREWCRENDG